MSDFKELKNKTVAVTGATGGIGRPLCEKLLALGANLILMDRNKNKSLSLRKELLKKFNNAEISNITVDLSSIKSVKAATEELKKRDFDIFIHNAGAYSIPRYKSDSGYDNVFTINFISPYYIIREILPLIEAKGGRVAVTGSIAHRYSKTDINDVDFSGRRAASKVYGNAKRYLMFSLFELFSHKQELLSVVHPGITFTGITDHYPKFIFAVIKYPMKVIFMKPEKACLSTVRGVLEHTPYHYWFGPRFFDVWGTPKLTKLRISQEESKKIAETAEAIYNEQTEKYKTLSL